MPNIAGTKAQRTSGCLFGRRWSIWKDGEDNLTGQFLLLFLFAFASSSMLRCTICYLNMNNQGANGMTWTGGQVNGQQGVLS